MALHPGPIVLAHPLTQQYQLPVSPAFAAAVALCVLIGAARLLTRRPNSTAAPHAAEGTLGRRVGPVPRETSARVVFFTTRGAGLALLALAIAAGMRGHPAQLSNIAPVLVVGFGWPALVVGSVILGNVWWWVDPFDTLGRVVAPLGAGDADDAAESTVVWGIPVAAVWVAYLTMWPGNLNPRSVGSAVAIYTLVTLGGCMALGRPNWLSRGEVFGIFFGMVAGVRRRRPPESLPRGTHLLLGVLAGGFVYGLLRDSALLAPFGYGPRATVDSALALAVIVLITTVVAEWFRRRAAVWGAGDAVGFSLVPATVALAIALALARNRFTTSAQLLPIFASDPFGSGIDLFGTRGGVIDPRPLGTGGLVAAQLLVLVVGHVLGAVIGRRTIRGVDARRARRALSPAVALLAILLTVAAAAVTATPL